MRTELGKIKSVEFGSGGYQDVQLGISFVLGGVSWGVTDFWGDWGIERSERAKWKEEDRITALGKTVMRIGKLLEDAKVKHVSQLEGVPVEVTFDGNVLQSWRVLKEVL